MQVSLGPEITPTKSLAQVYWTQTKPETSEIWQTRNITGAPPNKEGDEGVDGGWIALYQEGFYLCLPAERAQWVKVFFLYMPGSTWDETRAYCIF